MDDSEFEAASEVTLSTPLRVRRRRDDDVSDDDESEGAYRDWGGDEMVDEDMRDDVSVTMSEVPFEDDMEKVSDMMEATALEKLASRRGMFRKDVVQDGVSHSTEEDVRGVQSSERTERTSSTEKDRHTRSVTSEKDEHQTVGEEDLSPEVDEAETMETTETRTKKTHDNDEDKDKDKDKEEDKDKDGDGGGEQTEDEDEELDILGENDEFLEVRSRWRMKKKHFFLFTNAAKPIFSRYGDEGKLCGFMGVLQALISFVGKQNDQILSIRSKEKNIVFLNKGPINLVCVSGTGEPDHMIRVQLEYIHLQVLSILTNSVNRIFEKSPSYDLRSLLGGTGRTLHQLIHWMNYNIEFSLHGVRCLCLPKYLRSQIGDIMTEHGKTSDSLLCSILFIKDRLVHIARKKNFTIIPEDLLLCMNFFDSSVATRTTEMWTPFCLPRFNSRGFLYFYVAFLSGDLCLLLVSAKADAFYELKHVKERVAVKLFECKAIERVVDAFRKPAFLADDIGHVGLQDFVFMRESVGQIVRPDSPFTAPDGSPVAQTSEKESPSDRKKRLAWDKRFVLIYKKAIDAMNKSHARTMFWKDDDVNLYCLRTKSYQTYLILDSFAKKPAAISMEKHIRRYLKDRESSVFDLHDSSWE